MQSYERAHNAVQGCEVVFHQAALPSVPRSVQDPLTSNAANVVGTLNILLAARDSGVRRVVFASSSSVYGADPTLPKQRGPCRRCRSRPYAVAKLAGEGYCRSFSAVYGLETVALRYFNVFGPRQDPHSQYAAVIPTFITACLEGEPPDDLRRRRAVARLHLRRQRRRREPAGGRGAKGVAGQAFNIACGERISLNRLLDEIRAIVGSEVEAAYARAPAGRRQALARRHLARLASSSATSRSSTSTKA